MEPYYYGEIMEIDKIRQQLRYLQDDLHDIQYRVDGLRELVVESQPFNLEKMAQEAMDNVDDVVWSSYPRNRREFAVWCEQRTMDLFPNCVKTSMFTPGVAYSSGDQLKMGNIGYMCTGAGGSGGSAGSGGSGLATYPFGGILAAMGYGEGDR